MFTGVFLLQSNTKKYTKGTFDFVSPSQTLDSKLSVLHNPISHSTAPTNKLNMLPQSLLLGLLAITPLARAQGYGGSGGSSSSSTASSSAAATTTSSSSSSIHSITVGAGGALAFSPDSVTAAVGDTLVFSFQPGDHSVSQSTFGAPCTPSSGGIFSGFMSDTSNAFVVTVNNTDPIWLYCSQVGHCNAGMAMVVNPP